VGLDHRRDPRGLDRALPRHLRPNHRRRHPGRRDKFCPANGTYRNADLVAGISVHLPRVRALVFPLPGSRGTWDCLARARAARIPFDVIDLAEATAHA
jgi:hypothetical protein